MLVDCRRLARSLGSVVLAALFVLGALVVFLNRESSADAAVLTRDGMETGLVDVQHEWRTVTLTRTFTDPVVVVGPPTSVGSRSVVPAVRNVRTNSFEVRLVDWNGDTHQLERVAYLVLEAGTRTMGGKKWTAGHVDGVTERSRSVVLSGLGTTPTILATMVSSRGEDPAAVRVSRNANGFAVRMQEKEAGAIHYAEERVDYVAMETGSGSAELPFLSGSGAIAKTATVSIGMTLREPAVFAQLTAETASAAKALRVRSVSDASVTLGAESSGAVADSAYTTTPMSYLVLATAATPPTSTSSSSTSSSSTTTTTTTPPTPTSCPAPPSGTVVRITDPNANNQALIDSKPAGTTFLFGPGEFRGLEIRPKAGQKFYGSRSTDGRCRRLTTLNGSELLPNTGWTLDAGRWTKTGLAIGPIQVQSHGCEPGLNCDPGEEPGCEATHPKCQVATELFRNGVQQHHKRPAEVDTAAWSIEATRIDNNQPPIRIHAITVGSNPIGQKLELARKAGAFIPIVGRDGVVLNPTVHVEGFIIEKYASQHQHGAVGGQGGGDGWKIYDNELRLNHGAGFSVGPRGEAKGNYSHHNGNIGAKVNGKRSPQQIAARIDCSGFQGPKVLDNVLAHNNSSRVFRGWEAGGLKGSAHCATITGNYVYGNDGTGIWADVLAYGWNIRNNVVFNNANQGIFYEVSSDGVISGNTVGLNGRDKSRMEFKDGREVQTGWIWGAQIQIANSSNMQVYGNIVEVAADHGNGIAVTWVIRTGNYSGTTASNNRIYNNDVTYLGNHSIYTAVSGMRTDATRTDCSQCHNVYNPDSTGTHFYGNRYHTFSTRLNRFAGIDSNRMTLAQQQAAGQERNGVTMHSTIDAGVIPRTWPTAGPPGVIRP